MGDAIGVGAAPGGAFAPAAGGTAVEQLRAKVFARPWFHRIDLGHGIVTPGCDDSPRKLPFFHLPDRLDGWDVLDIGAYDGFFSFECEARGARRVVAADKYCWLTPAGTMGDGEGFRIAHAALNSRVERKEIWVEELSPDAVGTFDLVLFLGVLYHAPDMFRYLRSVRSVCRKLAVIETYCDALDYPRPAAVFYPGAVLNNDPSNWWGPNPACVIEMTKEAGFARCEQVDMYYGNRGVFHAFV
jgi:tRNA (mo5U34)-methyltransferase